MPKEPKPAPSPKGNPRYRKVLDKLESTEPDYADISVLGEIVLEFDYPDEMFIKAVGYLKKLEHKKNAALILSLETVASKIREMDRKLAAANKHSI